MIQRIVTGIFLLGLLQCFGAIAFAGTKACCSIQKEADAEVSEPQIAPPAPAPFTVAGYPPQGIVREKGVKLYLTLDAPLSKFFSYLFTLKGDAPEHFSDPFLFAQKLLFLADTRQFDLSTRSYAGEVKLQKTVAKANREIQIFRGGLEMTPGSYELEKAHISTLVLDNLKPFSFEDSSFDYVSMSRGMCHCMTSLTSCGGLLLDGKPDSQEKVKGFFREIIRVLNKENPLAFAYLHGEQFEHSITTHNNLMRTVEIVCQKRLLEVLTGLAPDYPSLEIKMIYLRHADRDSSIHDLNYGYRGVVIMSKDHWAKLTATSTQP